jgi:hypothetical protein
VGGVRVFRITGKTYYPTYAPAWFQGAENKKNMGNEKKKHLINKISRPSALFVWGIGVYALFGGQLPKEGFEAFLLWVLAMPSIIWSFASLILWVVYATQPKANK